MWTRYQEIKTYCANGGANLLYCATLQKAHDSKKGNGIEQSTHGDAINEPLDGCILPVELWWYIAVALRRALGHCGKLYAILVLR